MKKVSFICLMALLLNYGIVSVYAEEEEEEVLSGKELVDGCSEGYLPGQPNQYCMQYIFSLVTYVDTLQQQSSGEKLFCIDPTAVRLEEVTDNVTKWMENVPDRLNEDAYILVSQALHESYPCSTTNI